MLQPLKICCAALQKVPLGASSSSLSSLKMDSLHYLVIYLCLLAISLASTCPNVLQQQQQYHEIAIDRFRSHPDPFVVSALTNDSSQRSYSIASFTEKLNHLFNSSLSKEQRNLKLQSLLENLELNPIELAKYAQFDSKYAYTRNLVATDGQHYSLLVLCWGAGKSSRIHNHPCDGCYVKVLSGSLKETRYTIDNVNKEIKFNCELISNPGTVTFMNDDIGLHKISNPSSDIGAVSLHLYTPPFQSCKVWESAGKSLLSSFEAKMCSYSQFGYRNPMDTDSNLMFYI